MIEKLLQTVETQTKNVKGEETFIFLYNNPNTLRKAGAEVVGNLDDVARLTAVLASEFTPEQKRLFYTHLIMDDPDGMISIVEDYLEILSEEE